LNVSPVSTSGLGVLELEDSEEEKSSFNQGINPLTTACNLSKQLPHSLLVHMLLLLLS